MTHAIRSVHLRVWCVAAAIAGCSVAATAQTRSLAQDSTLDNLRHAPNIATAPPGTLGAVVKRGTGRRAMILIPGLGFGATVFDEFATARGSDYTTYALTLPGFDGTPPLPMPVADSAGFAHAAWTRSGVRAVVALMDRERITRATLVAHWIGGSQIALKLATEHPERFDGVVLIAGVAKAYYDGDTSMLHWSLDRRARYADALGGQWFRTVTRRTWDDNNFMPYDYSRHPVRGLFLWRDAASASLPVWIRYLLEFYAMDVTSVLERLRVPALVVQPGFDDAAFYVEPGRNYMRNLTRDSWRDVERTPGRIEFARIPGARLFVMYDDPAALERVVVPFLSRIVVR